MNGLTLVNFATPASSRAPSPSHPRLRRVRAYQSLRSAFLGQLPPGARSSLQGTIRVLPLLPGLGALTGSFSSAESDSDSSEISRPTRTVSNVPVPRIAVAREIAARRTNLHEAQGRNVPRPRIVPGALRIPRDTRTTPARRQVPSMQVNDGPSTFAELMRLVPEPAIQDEPGSDASWEGSVFSDIDEDVALILPGASVSDSDNIVAEDGRRQEDSMDTEDDLANGLTAAPARPSTPIDNTWHHPINARKVVVQEAPAVMLMQAEWARLFGIRNWPSRADRARRELDRTYRAVRNALQALDPEQIVSIQTKRWSWPH